jgi:hypothetical protein
MLQIRRDPPVARICSAATGSAAQMYAHGKDGQRINEPPRTADVRALFDAMINDDPLPGENDQNAQNFGSAPPKSKSRPSKAPTASPTTQARAEQVQAVTTAPQDVTVRSPTRPAR